MELIVDLEPEALERAESLAAERGQSVGKVLSDALLGHHGSLERPEATLGVDAQGFPQIHIGRPITSEEIKAMIAEDEEWEITRGNPYHAWYGVDPDRTVFPEGYPRVVDGPLGLPEVQLGPPVSDIQKRIANEE